jgi:6-phosphogluconate dehydrogenase
MSASADIAVIGLAVMGQNLILNMNDHGFKVVAYNRTYQKTKDFLEGTAKDTAIIGADSLEALVNSLSSPRKIMLMVQAGAAVDSVIQNLLPLLDKGDIIIDGGNSKFDDSERRALAVRKARATAPLLCPAAIKKLGHIYNRFSNQSLRKLMLVIPVAIG